MAKSVARPQAAPLNAKLPALIDDFRRRFGATPRVFRAPGRVNLIGEHTDYNAGFVMPAAISFDTLVLAAPRSDRRLRMHSTNLDATLERGLDEVPGAPVGTAARWSDYLWGTACSLMRLDIAVAGADLLIHGEVPIGSGLSSSAALEVAAARALLGLAGASLAPVAIARACQLAENEYVGMRCGIMDQYAAACGRAGHALWLDCRSLEHEAVPLVADADGTGFRIVICNSMVRHQHAGGEYNRRRAECESGVHALATRWPGVLTLRDATLEMLEEAKSALGPTLWRRCHHIVTENARVAGAAAALRAGDLQRVGTLMHASHVSLRDEYAVSCAELDCLVEIATVLPGVHGARMTGGGFGGCTVNLVESGAVDEFRARVGAEYQDATGYRPEIYVCEAAAGAGEVHV